MNICSKIYLFLYKIIFGPLYNSIELTYIISWNKFKSEMDKCVDIAYLETSNIHNQLSVRTLKDFCCSLYLWVLNIKVSCSSIILVKKDIFL